MWQHFRGPGRLHACVHATLPSDLWLFLRGQELFQRNPDSYNGAVRENYTWSQDYTDLELKVPVPRHVLKGRQVMAPPATWSLTGESPALCPGLPSATWPITLCHVRGAGHLLITMVLWRSVSAGDAARWEGSPLRGSGIQDHSSAVTGSGPAPAELTWGLGVVTVASSSSRSLVGGPSPGKPH